ncbi:MAG TPA: GNAT family N-acetyltransferase [Nocardioidaceae bacterium]|nr:GNAT family N-acetyltransferase [Nocardioidaceae bacterium]
MIVRPATGADAVAVAALEHTLFGADAWSRASVVAELTAADRTALVAVAGEDLVGYAVTMRAGDLVDLQRIGVDAECRRRGVAHALLTAITGRAAADGALRMLLEVGARNTGALAFYAAEGFVEIDRRRRYYRDGSDALVLHRALGGGTPGRAGPGGAG